MADAMDVDGPVGPVTKGPKGKTAVAGKEGVERFTVKKTAPSLGESATTLSTFTVSLDGSRLDKFAP
ncbi:hypothetical protein QFC24_004796 [Naganishia onofrii]|uniref:Uncharacterized protein n=1 Tax=Naganishia onofrii TaxID=1851511 RepID=A0ACC2XBC8_9TREE|nr:hypothetical protein QFC24_004796 [Naganishia onofrii]